MFIQSRLECHVAAENYKKSGIVKKQKYRIKIIKKFQETCTCKGSCGGPLSEKTSKGTFRFRVKYMRDHVFGKATDSEHLQFSKHRSPESTSTVQKNWTLLLTNRRKVINHLSIQRWQRLFRGEEPFNKLPLSNCSKFNWSGQHYLAHESKSNRARENPHNSIQNAQGERYSTRAWIPYRNSEKKVVHNSEISKKWSKAPKKIKCCC